MNNDYNIFKIGSNYMPFGICVIVLMTILSIFIFTKDVIELSLYNSPVVIDLEANSNHADAERLMGFLASDALVQDASIEYIAKSSSKDILGKSIDSVIINRMIAAEVFHDLILFKFKNEIRDKYQRDEFLEALRGMQNVSEVNATSKSIIKPNNWLQKIQFVFLPIIIFICIVLMAIIAFVVRQNMQTNISSWTTLSLLGIKGKLILKNYNKALIGVLIKSWFSAVLLFLGIFYLMLYRFNISFYDIGPIKLIVVLIVPLLIFSISIMVTSFLSRDKYKLNYYG